MIYSALNTLSLHDALPILTFYLGEEIREEEIKAKFENGILSVSIPKEEEKKVEGPKHISIEG